MTNRTALIALRNAVVERVKREARNEALREAANAMMPMLRSMISRGEAYRTIMDLIKG